MTEFTRGNGPHPDPVDWFEGSGRKLEIQTEKSLWKIVPCTAGDCNTDLLVNTFYAPHKAKCSEHNESGHRAIASSNLVSGQGNPDAKPNGALAKLLCPICGNPMILLNINEGTGALTFRCLDGSNLSSKEVSKLHDAGAHISCGTAVTVKPKMAWMEMKNYPSDLKSLIDDWNIGQRVAFYDKLEAESPGIENA